jgi:hypothetical protein
MRFIIKNGRYAHFMCKKYPAVMIKSVHTLVTTPAMFAEFANLKFFICKSARPDNTTFHF